MSNRKNVSMKKIFFLSIFISLGILRGLGQSEKNDLKITMAVLPLFGSSDEFDSTINGVAIKPSIGYFITTNTSIDLNFSYAAQNALTIADIDSHYYSFAFTPTLRNYFINKKTLRVFAEFGIGLGTIKYDADNSSLKNIRHEDLSGGISILNIGIGGTYFFNEKFGLEVIIPYLNTKNITSEKVNTLYTGIGPTIGLTYILN